VTTQRSESAPWAAWTRPKIIRAAQRWALEHGRPPSATDWRPSSPTHPNESQVRRLFGTWNAMIERCGWEPREPHRPAVWTRDRAQQALFEWTYTHGRTPMFKDWKEPCLGRPSARQALTLYGSWNAMLVAGGYSPRVMYRTHAGYQRQAGSKLRTRDEQGRVA
jgi:hypothetical protein